MKALTIHKYGPTKKLQINEVPVPKPKDDEVLIKVCSVSINDWDIGLITGRPFVIRLISGLIKPGIKIPGVDVAGKIVETGKNIKHLRQGDEVMGDLSESGFGAFAEYVCASEKSLTKKPADMSFEDAAAIPHAGMLAIQGLIDAGHIQYGEQLLINGAGGGVGTLGIQLASLYDAEATGVDSAEKLDTLQSLGYKHVIDYKQRDFTKTRNRYDLILDVKTNRPARKYMRALKKHGRYVTVGGSLPLIFSGAACSLLYSLFGKKHFRILSLKPNKDMDIINDFYITRKLKPVIDGPYLFQEIPRLIKHFEEGKHIGKIVIKV